MLKSEKERVVEQLAERLRSTDTLMVADYRGLTMPEIDELRGKLLEAGARFTVVKNTLTRRAAEQAGTTDVLELIEGPTAIAYSTESEVEPVRVVVEFAKKHERPVVKAGVIGEKLYTKKELIQLAALPSREELLSQVLAVVIAPMTQFLGAVNALLASPATLAGELEKKQQSS